MNGKKSLPRSRKFRERVTAVVACTGAIAMTAGFMMMAMVGPANADHGNGNGNHDNNGQGGVNASSNGNNDNGNGAGNQGNNGQGDNEKKVNVCHATSSVTNPYVFINVSENAVKEHGHRMHRESPNKTWNADATWNGTFYAAGSPRRDWINSFTDNKGSFVSLDGTIVTEAWCEADPTGSRQVTPQISVVDPCGTANDRASAVPNAGYTSVKNGNVFTFLQNQGFTLSTTQLTAVFSNNGACPTTPPPTITDVCPNLAGNQATVPGDRFKNSAGNCVLPTIAPTDVCPNLAGNQANVPRGMDKVNGECAEPPLGVEETEPPVKKPPVKQPEVKGTEEVPTAVAAGIGGNGPMNGSSPIDLLAQMLVGGGLALLLSAGWMQMGRKANWVNQA